MFIYCHRDRLAGWIRVGPENEVCRVLRSIGNATHPNTVRKHRLPLQSSKSQNSEPPAKAPPSTTLASSQSILMLLYSTFNSRHVLGPAFDYIELTNCVLDHVGAFVRQKAVSSRRSSDSPSQPWLAYSAKHPSL
jgi:hypothetical protein